MHVFWDNTFIIDRTGKEYKPDFYSKYSQVLGKAAAGEMFGEIGVLCHMPQPFTVRTTEISQILRLNKITLTNIIRANAEDGRIIMNNFYQV